MTPTMHRQWRGSRRNVPPEQLSNSRSFVYTGVWRAYVDPRYPPCPEADRYLLRRPRQLDGKEVPCSHSWMPRYITQRIGFPPAKRSTVAFLLSLYKPWIRHMPLFVLFSLLDLDLSSNL
jgi:hypothetical protein